MKKKLTVKQMNALTALAEGESMERAAKLAGYSSVKSVYTLKHSTEGIAYLDAMREMIMKNGVFRIEERLRFLRTIVKIQLIDSPAVALSALKEANRLSKCGR